MSTRILIYGAGVIGCLYATRLSEAGCSVAVYARGRRLASLRERGLLYRKDGEILRAEVEIIDALDPDELYDYIFLTVREEQLYAALDELRDNKSPSILTMVNSLDPYVAWEERCGKGRIIAGFPGAGGGWDGNVLDAALTPRIIQPTTFAEPHGERTERVKRLAAIFRRAHIPYEIVRDMHAWQLCHLALVVPLADAYYQTSEPERVFDDRRIMRGTAERLRKNFRALSRYGERLSPRKLRVFLVLPSGFLGRILRSVYKSDFGERFMFRHAMKAPEEMRRLHDALYEHPALQEDKA